MSRVTFPPKLSGSTILLPFDFLSSLAVGETLSSASTTATVYSGSDSSPSSLISGSTSVSGSIATQKITGGVAGVIYEVLCTASTSAGETLQLSGYLAIVPDLV